MPEPAIWIQGFAARRRNSHLRRDSRSLVAGLGTSGESGATLAASRHKPGPWPHRGRDRGRVIVYSLPSVHAVNIISAPVKDYKGLSYEP
jgi:hypothetical protein